MVTTPPYVSSPDYMLPWREWVQRSFLSTDNDRAADCARITILETRLLSLVHALGQDAKDNPKALEEIPETAKVVAGFAMEDMEEK